MRATRRREKTKASSSQDQRQKDSTARRPIFPERLLARVQNLRLRRRSCLRPVPCSFLLVPRVESKFRGSRKMACDVPSGRWSGERWLASELGTLRRTTYLRHPHQRPINRDARQLEAQRLSLPQLFGFSQSAASPKFPLAY